ncbi:AMP-binding protein [Flavisphingomonas formosensis]|uniref:AMP-binding protein n=1 Tax=Flavisphingomonas formosensis TaxID=861534 RepID=UPI0012FB87CD|nr:AMP-binding protein [Sphingomonas formosensis]
MTLNLSDPVDRTLPAVLSSWARATPDAIFLMSDEGQESFAETDRKVNRIANGLIAFGVGQGDRVAILMGSRPDYVRIVLAANRIGAIWVPINPDYRGDWLVEAIADSLPAALIIDGVYSDRLAQVVDRLSVPRIAVLGAPGPLAGRVTDFAEIADASDAPPPPIALSYGDTAAILWTSGTTGKPKGVMQSHNAWINSAESGNRMWETRAGDVAYNCLPLYNSAAWAATVFRALVAGIPVAMDSAFSVSSFWDRIRHYGATQTMSLGAMHMFLWNAPERPDDRANPLRTVSMVPLPEHLIDPICARFGIEKISQGFGQSEVMTLIGRECFPGARNKPNALGKVSEDFELRLVDDDGREVPVGETGEFAVKAKKPHILFNGYFNNPEATAQAWRDGWFLMGDLGRMDADGDYFFVDRKKDYIRYKGRSVSSFQVESVANRFPGIAQCAAYGVPSAELDSEHEIKLDVVPKPGMTIDPATLARFINDNAPHFIVPRYIEVVDALPYTPTNKVEKYKLRAKGVTAQTWDRQAEAFELVR